METKNVRNHKKCSVHPSSLLDGEGELMRPGVHDGTPAGVEFDEFRRDGGVKATQTILVVGDPGFADEAVYMCLWTLNWIVMYSDQ